jgi:hypothetical protein
MFINIELINYFAKMVFLKLEVRQGKLVKEFQH